MAVGREAWTRFITGGKKAQSTADAITASLSEDDWQAQVRQIAGLCRWTCYHTHDSRNSDDGFPDLVMIRLSGRPRQIAAELKREGEEPTAAQKMWLNLFSAVGAETYVWRPSDFDRVSEVLR